MTPPEPAPPADEAKPIPTVMLPLSRIKPGYNPRRYFDRRKHDDLVASLGRRGMVQPMLVRPAPDDPGVYAIVDGGRRFRAALEAFGLAQEAPVLIREMTDHEALLAAIDANEVRDDTSETEQADAAVRVLAAYEGDRAEAAARLGWSRSKLDRRLALAELAEPVKTALDERRIKLGHAELLAAIPADKQEKALETILASGLEVGKTRELLMRVTQDLGAACFDKSDCTTCPFNSAMQRTLFATHVDDGQCTNRDCFQLKTEAVEALRREEQERAAAAARAAAPAIPTADAPTDDDADEAQSPIPITGAAPRTDPAPVPSTSARASTGIDPNKPSVTAQVIARRTSDLREATWRTALARSLARDVSRAYTAVLVAAMTGTLSQIKPDTLASRAGLLIGDDFPERDFTGKIAAICALSAEQGANALAAVGAAYVRDVSDFRHVADLARAFEIDLRDHWRVDQAFLERFTRDELKFIARECGFIAHKGDKSFASLLGGKKADLITGMLNAIGFDWAGRLPGAMTLDGQYGPPPPASDLPIAA